MQTKTKAPTSFTKAERATIQSVTHPAWWGRRPVWSGIRSELEKLARAAESRGLIEDARAWSRLAAIAGEKEG